MNSSNPSSKESDMLNQLRVNPPNIMREKEAAAYLGISDRTLQKLRAAGRIRAASFGRCVRYRRETLDKFIAIAEA